MMTPTRSRTNAASAPLAFLALALSLVLAGGLEARAQSSQGSPPGGKQQTLPDGAPKRGPEAKPAPDKKDDKAGAKKGPLAAPKVPETAAEKARLLGELYAHLATAEDAATAGRIASSIEALWAHSGSDTVNLLMQRAAIAAAKSNNEVALKLLDYVIELAPDFAEGFNRRAYLHFAMNDAEKAVGDLRRAIALEPFHFKALEGLAQIWRETGNKRGAYHVLRQLLDIHPHAAGARQSLDELAKDVEGQGI